MAQPLKNPPSLKEFQKWLKENGITTDNQLKKFDKTKFPANYPKTPLHHYKKTGEIKSSPELFDRKPLWSKIDPSKAPTIEEYGKWLIDNGVTSQTEFDKFDKTKFPANYPKDPPTYYRKLDVWKSWSHLFGKKSRYNDGRDSHYIDDSKAPTIEEYGKWLIDNGVTTREKLKNFDRTKFPANYPIDPSGFYKRMGTWKGWSHLFGRKSPYIDYSDAPTIEEYSKFLIDNGVTKREEFKEFAKTKLPANYPAGPAEFYKRKGTWKSWSDFLGQRSHYIDDSKAPTIEEYGKWLIDNGVTSQTELQNFDKTKLPANYPKDPPTYYRKLDVWKSWSHLFGRKSPYIDDSKAPTIEEYSKFLINNGVTSFRKFQEFDKTKLPANYPKAPVRFYKRKGTWKSWSDFLGQRSHYIDDSKAPTIEEYGKWLIGHGVTTSIEFDNFDKTKLPTTYPKDPSTYYRKLDVWKGWPNLFGNRPYRLENPPTYEEYKSWLKPKNLDSQFKFYEYCKKNELPPNYPLNPSNFYLIRKEWISWYDFLGKTDVRVTISNLQNFVKSLIDSGLLEENTSAGFNYSLMMSNKNLNLNSPDNRKLIQTIAELPKTPTGQKTIKDLVEGNFSGFQGRIERELEKVKEDREKEEAVIGGEEEKKKKDRNLLGDNKRDSNSKILDETDIFETVTVDEEKMEFIYRFFINRLWINCFEAEQNEQQEIVEDAIQRCKDSLNHKNEVRRAIAQKFIEEFHGANNLSIPPLKAKNKKTGKIITPWLSQLLTAYKVTTKKSFANFSGTGAGKTLSAIIAAKAINAKMTVIICPNTLIQNGQWEREAENCFDGNYTITGYDAFHEKHDENKSKFLIINWDKLNQKGKSTELVKTLAKQKIDLIVIDEIHFAKNTEAIRYQNLAGLITKARRKNPDFKTLAMTATPIVNELIEGKTQLQLLTGTQYNDLKTTPYTSNAISLWEKFTTVDIRHRPEYGNIIYKDIDVHAPVPSEAELEFLNKNPLAIEQFLTDYRIPEILKIIKKIKSPVIIYTDYVGAVKDLPNHKSITQKLASALQKEGYEFGFYIGKDKSGLADFVDKKIDILIASNPLAVGVDKLQYRCKHLIFNSLPWTNARYRQIIGRIARPGVEKDEPITIYHVRGNFPAKEYDLKEKLDKIEYKERIADCALDGENLPEGRLPSHQSVIKNTIDWLKRLNRNERSIVTRNPYEVEFPSDEVTRDLKKHGDLESMNQKFGASDSKTIFEMMQTDPTFLEHYTDQQKKSEIHLTINPTDYLIGKLEEMPTHFKISDMGCGLQNKIHKRFGSRVKSFDGNTENIDELISCDIADVSEYVKTQSQDVVIFSQSLMCKNWPDMIAEGARCLRKFGQLMIVVQTQQWRNRIKKLLNVIGENGFSIIGEPMIKGEFTFIDAQKTRGKKL